MTTLSKGSGYYWSPEGIRSCQTDKVVTRGVDWDTVITTLQQQLVELLAENQALKIKLNRLEGRVEL